jgi:hypothetical protein
MRNIMNRPIAAVIGVIAFSNVGIGSAAAADIPTTPPQAQVQPPPPDYYASPPVEEGYVYPPPVVYGYPPPPPISYYEYAAPQVVIIPRPYYLGRHYGPIYGGVPYGVRSYGPHIARAYGPYDHQWGRGYRGW